MFESTGTFISTAGADPVSYWGTWVNLVSTVAAGATGALAWFAKVQIDSANREKQDRQAVADARISALAYAVRRQVRSWLALDSAPQVVKWKAEISPTFARVENCLQMALAEVHASPMVRAALREALVRYYRAMDTFDQLPSPPDEMSVDKGASIWGGLGTLHAEVESCADSLRGAIDPELEAADKGIPHLLGEAERREPDALAVPAPR